jgi:hypothetical protein
MRDPERVTHVRRPPARRIRTETMTYAEWARDRARAAVSRQRRLLGHGTIGKSRVVTGSAQTRPEISRHSTTAMNAPGAYR